jgi:hypothetical protein
MNTPSLEQLKRGVQIAEKIAALQSEMGAIFQDQMVSPKRKKASPQSPKKRRMSPEGLARIIAAQKKRRAREKSAKAQPTHIPAKKKRTVSPEARAKLAASMKARWAERKASNEPTPIVSTPPNAVL